MTHWHLGYSNKTACGILAYKTDVSGEFDTATNGRIECSNRPTCLSCQRVMRIGKFEQHEKRKLVCALCGRDANWDEQEQVYRHDVSTEEKLFAATFCDRYGYPIPIKESAQ